MAGKYTSEFTLKALERVHWAKTDLRRGCRNSLTRGKHLIADNFGIGDREASALAQLDFPLDRSKTNDNCWPQLDAIRERDPVFWSTHQRAWMITRHEDVKAGLSDRRLSAARLAPVFAKMPAAMIDKYQPLIDTLNQWIVAADAPFHTRMRKLLLQGFTTEAIESLRPFTQSAVDKLLDEAEQNKQIEFIQDFCFVLPALVIMKLLGVHESRLQEFKRWSMDIANLASRTRPTLEMMDKALASVLAMDEVFRGLIAERRADPQDDFLTAMVKARDEDDMMSDEEILACCSLIMFAGHETTTNQLGIGLLELIHHPDQVEVLRQNSENIAACSQELQRYNATIGAAARIVLEDFEWHGKQLRKGQVVFLMVHAANRDPRVYERAGELDLTRKNQYPLSFGPGIHFCLGHQLAKMELEITFKTIFSRFGSVELLDRQADWNSSFVLRGLRQLNVRFH